MGRWISPPLNASAFATRTQAGPEVMADLEVYYHALAQASTRMNVVGPSALAQFWPRHVFDSAQLRWAAPAAQRYVDIGSGSGFPGVVLAILLKAEGGHVHLIESQARRCDFLRTVVTELRLPATVHRARAEAGPPLDVEVVTARACAPMSRLLGFVSRYLTSDRQGLFLKGRTIDAELAEARRLWRFKETLIPSLSDPDGRIVEIKGLSRA